MSEVVSIPRGTFESQGPCWIPRENMHGRNIRPVIKCNCQKICYISLHHVHDDGRVTESFFDSKDVEFTHQGKTYGHVSGCGWHVYLQLLDYDQGEFPPQP